MKNYKSHFDAVAGLIEAYDNGNGEWVRKEAAKLPTEYEKFVNQMISILDEWRSGYNWDDDSW